MTRLPPTAKLLIAVAVAFITGVCVTWVGTQAFTGQNTSVEKTVAEKKPAPATPAKPAPKPKVTPPPVEPALVPEPAEIAEITDLIRASYAGATELVGVELTQEKIVSLFTEPDRQLRLLAKPRTPPQPAHPNITLLPRRIIYWKLPGFSKANIDEFARSIEAFQRDRPLGLVLDLRENADPDNYEGAADLLSLFASPESTLFTVQELKTAQQLFRAGRQPLNLPAVFPIVVLVQAQTRGAAEVAAEWLSQRRGALLAGQPTAGEAWPSRDFPLKSGRTLKMPIARAVSPTGQNLGLGPLTPDIPIEINPVEQAAALAWAASGKIAETVAEIPTRKRQSEASLINEENPELDELIAEQKGDQKKPDPAPRDRVLHQALDVVEAISILQSPNPTTR
jgi:hypothetical protein